MTIDDIAEALGVSKTTVSRAISGKGRISESTREKVRAYIREHNYKPNVYAQGLANRCTMNIGVVWPGETAAEDLPFFQKCLLGINKTAAENGYDLILTICKDGEITSLKRIVENRKVDGVILTRTLVEDAPADYLKKAGMPFVSVGSSMDPAQICVDNANEAACRELTRQLLDRGISRLALIGGSTEHVITRTRLRGYREGFAAAGKALQEDLICMEIQNAAQAEEATRKMLKAGAEGIIGMDDQIAGEVLTLCHRMGVEIPGQLRLASFYDSTFLAHSVPAVTALQFDDTALGEEAAAALIRMLKGEKVQSTVLDNYRIQLRETFY